LEKIGDILVTFKELDEDMEPSEYFKLLILSNRFRFGGSEVHVAYAV